LIGLLLPCVAEAHQGYIDVTAQGSDNAALPGPPTNFVAIAVGNQIDLTWTKGISAVTTIIRGQYGSYPDNITDGYEVYNGVGTSVTDMQNISSSGEGIYYRAWSHNVIGYSVNYAQTYVVGGMTGMSNALFFIGSIIFLCGLMFGSIHYKLWPITIMTGFLWLGEGVWAFRTSIQSYDMYIFVGIASLFLFLTCIVIPFWMRTKIQAEVPKTLGERVEADYGSLGKGRRRVRRASDDDLVE
jgi:hypothetical protein